MPKTQYGTIIKVDGTHTEILPANGKKFSLKELQKAVGGYIELVHFADGHGLGHYTAYVNEDGLGMGLPINRKATEMYQRGRSERVGIVGDLLIVRSRESVKRNSIPSTIFDGKSVAGGTFERGE